MENKSAAVLRLFIPESTSPHLNSPPPAAPPASEVFHSLRMMSPSAETQVTLLKQTRTEDVLSSPSYSFHILWHKTRQLHSDTIVWLTVDSGWTLCAMGLWKNWAVASLFFFSIETSDCHGRNGCCQASLMSQLINELAEQRLN